MQTPKPWCTANEDIRHISKTVRQWLCNCHCLSQSWVFSSTTTRWTSMQLTHDMYIPSSGWSPPRTLNPSYLSHTTVCNSIALCTGIQQYIAVQIYLNSKIHSCIALEEKETSPDIWYLHFRCLQNIGWFVPTTSESATNWKFNCIGRKNSKLLIPNWDGKSLFNLIYAFLLCHSGNGYGIDKLNLPLLIN